MEYDNITIAITTYNRLLYLKQMRQSLYETINLDKCNIRIYDDCSTELDINDLQSLFPEAKQIIIRNKNIGADKNQYEMYKEFLNTADKILVIMDADLICRPDWLSFSLANFYYTDGIMSVYNSAFHPAHNKVFINDTLFLLKKSIGAAGAIMHRDIIMDIVNNIPQKRGYDWAWSKYLTEKGIRIFVSNESYIQHIGICGYNCDGLDNMEYSLKFKPMSSTNFEILANYYSEVRKLRLSKLLERYNTKISKK